MMPMAARSACNSARWSRSQRCRSGHAGAARRRAGRAEQKCLRRRCRPLRDRSTGRPELGNLSNKLGPLLLGLSPLLADESNGTDKRILVGPINDLSQATELCARLERVSIACMPMPFTGTHSVYSSYRQAYFPTRNCG